MDLKVKNLHKSFPKFDWKTFTKNDVHILKGMDFEVSSGSFHGFIGPNGAGKTTTIQAILGIITKDQGKILVDDKKIFQSELNSRIGYIPHEVTFPKHLSGLNFIMEMIKMYGLPLYSEKFDSKEIKLKLDSMSEKQLAKLIQSPRLARFLNHASIVDNIDILNKEVEAIKEELKTNQSRKKYYDKKIKQIEKAIVKQEKNVEKEKESLETNLSVWISRREHERLFKLAYNLERLAYENNPEISMKAKAVDMFKQYGIAYAMHKNPNEYSSGMKKKILLIHALINEDAEFLLLDEPAANLDPDARIELFNTLYELNKKGMTVFICSHILKELEGMVNEVTIVNSGLVKFNGKIGLDTDVTKLYTTAVGKKFGEEITIPTKEKNLQKDYEVAAKRLERMVTTLENRISDLENENRQLKENSDFIKNNKV